MKRILILATIVLISSCECIEFYYPDDDSAPADPTMFELAITCDNLIGNTYGHSPQISDGYTGLEGEDVDWFSYPKVGYIGGSLTYKFYHIGNLPDTIYPTTLEDNKIPGFQTPEGIFNIIEVGIDSFKYDALQAHVKVGGITGNNPISDGGNTGLSIISVYECEGWANLGDKIFLTHE